MALVGNWNYPTSIRFGAGRIKELADACKAVGFKRPLLVTDPGLARLPMIADAVNGLRRAGIDVGLFSEVRPNPVASNVEAGLRTLRAGKCDGVIAWGGGSGIDTAKAIAFMAGQTRPLWDFEDIGDWWTRANPAGILPIDRGADDGGHRIGDRPRVGDHRRGDAHQEGDLPSEDDARDRDRRSRADGRPAGQAHGGHRPGRVHPLLRGLLRAGLPSLCRGHRRRGHAAGEGEPRAGGEERPRPRGARPHAGGLADGLDRFPEGPGRDPFAVASGRARCSTRITA